MLEDRWKYSIVNEKNYQIINEYASKKKLLIKTDINFMLAITIQRIVIMRENGVLIQMLM